MKKLLLLSFTTLFCTTHSFAQVPVISPIQGPSAVCSAPAAGKIYSTSATNNPSSYNWFVIPGGGVTIANSSAANTAINFPNTNSSYTVYASASNSFGSSATTSFVVNVFETPTVTFTGAMKFCQGSSTFLMASSTMISASSTLSYSWMPSTGLSSTNTYSTNATPNTTTTYSVLLTMGNCTNMAVTTLTVDPLPAILPVFNRTVICQGAAASLTINGGSDPYYINSVYTPSITSLSPATTTSYSISASTINGCTKTTVVTLSVVAASNCVGIAENTQTQVDYFQVYPNPSSGSFSIKASRNEMAVLTNQLGQKLQTVNLRENETVSVTELSDGLYYLVTPQTRIKIVVYH